MPTKKAKGYLLVIGDDFVRYRCECGTNLKLENRLHRKCHNCGRDLMALITVEVKEWTDAKS